MAKKKRIKRGPVVPAQKRNPITRSERKAIRNRWLDEWSRKRLIMKAEAIEHLRMELFVKRKEAVEAARREKEATERNARKQGPIAATRLKMLMALYNITEREACRVLTTKYGYSKLTIGVGLFIYNRKPRSESMTKQ